MTRDEKAFLDAICAAPEDDLARLAYADWLDERDDPRGAYLRAEVEHFREGRANHPAELWERQKGVDLVWANMVSRAPFGIVIPGLTFSERGPRITTSFLKRIEKKFGCPLPPDYAAFLLRYNGGRPSKPYLYSYMDWVESEVSGREDLYDALVFSSSATTAANGRRWLLSNVVELHDGRVAPGADAGQLARLLPIAALELDGEDEQNILGLVMEPEVQFERIIEVVYGDEGLYEERSPVHNKGSFVELLTSLCEWSDE